MKIRVVLAEDQAMVLGALAALLELEPDIEVIARCANGRDALRAVEKLAPDVLVTDIEMPEMTGLEVAAALHELYPAKFELKNLDRLMVNARSAKALAAGVDPREIARDWQAALAEFEKTRGKYLLY